LQAIGKAIAARFQPHGLASSIRNLSVSRDGLSLSANRK
jgi:hypothetical protein